MKGIVARRREAAERAEIHSKLSTKEKLARLDAMFGFGKGAAKERKKLEALLKAEK